ncbi:GntR family transcriptional regulator [Brucella pseudogrignonensis]|uniref:DNA-binding GntR family transcriptional regulator n=1 Tax=Brucella pseudogrignonensis TaxID=419475 RepID=A0ABU1MGF0_9HYPH|nr:GntR family transcriptional regulator [Brucella pseudogrignonensis]MDR6434840.1 DNA-binding GntR family transcriptional regulator [Brucella pseudogrignonensis]
MTGLASQTFDSIQKSTFRDHIVEKLRKAIIGGAIEPGAQIVETELARQFAVSRGPLREAMRQLIDEGLLVTIPYTGTRVVSLTTRDIHEIYSMRVNLEIFAFELAWDRRDQAFRDELVSRNNLLTQCIDNQDDVASIEAELKLHSLVYEVCGHRLLQRVWEGVRGRLQLYWAAHHRAHGMQGPKRDGHDIYVTCGLANDLDAMRSEIRDHMSRGLEKTKMSLNGE